MNFDRETGKHLQLIVSAHTLPGGATKIGFKPEFKGFDDLLYEALRSQMTDAECATADSADSFDMLDAMVYGSVSSHRFPRTGPESSMRIYHLSGSTNPELKVGDEWKVQVVKCYAATQSTPRRGGPPRIEWTEPKTRDGRTKIHYSVRPVERVVTEERSVDWSLRCVVTRTTCGSNVGETSVPFDDHVNGEFHHPDAGGSGWVIFGQVARVGDEVLTWPIHVETSNRWMQKKNNDLGGRMDTKRLKALWRALPQAPAELWTAAVNAGEANRALTRNW